MAARRPLVAIAGQVTELAAADSIYGSAEVPVPFTATNATYTVPTGFKVIGVWIRPGANGGGGGGGGGAGSAANNGGGGAGSGGKAGTGCRLTYIPIKAAAGDVLDVHIGAGGNGGAGGGPGANGTVGDAGTHSYIDNTTTGKRLVRAAMQDLSAVGGQRGNLGAVGTATGGGGGAAASLGTNVTNYGWPVWDHLSTSTQRLVPNNSIAGGDGGTSAAGSNANGVGASLSLNFGSSPMVTAGTSGTGGTAATRGGGGAGGGGSHSTPGDEFYSELGIDIPASTGAGSGRGGDAVNGGNANNAGAGSAGSPGNNGQTGALGRGGGGGSGGGGGGAGSTTGGAGGTAGTGGNGSAGAAILILAPT